VRSIAKEKTTISFVKYAAEIRTLGRQAHWWQKAQSQGTAVPLYRQRTAASPLWTEAIAPPQYGPISLPLKSRHNLLRKIETVPEKLAHILNLRGLGYLFERPRFNRETASQTL